MFVCWGICNQSHTFKMKKVTVVKMGGYLLFNGTTIIRWLTYREKTVVMTSTLCVKRFPTSHFSEYYTEFCVKRRELLVVSRWSFEVFTNAQNWQCWHYCQLCIPIYFPFPSLFVPYDVCKCEITNQWI